MSLASELFEGRKKSYYIWLWRKNSEILAFVAGAWKYWAQEKRGARHRHPSRVSLAPTTSKPPAKQATQIREVMLVNETWQARCLIHNKL